MKRFFVCVLCLLLAVTPALAETMVTPIPSADSAVVESKLPEDEFTIDDVLTAWSALDANQDAYTTLASDEKMISTEILFRLLITYCMQVNADTTCENMADYEPEITVENEQIRAVMMTHDRCFIVTLNAYTGECVELTIDERANG